MMGQEAFLEIKVTPIITPLVEELLLKKPDDPVGFMIDYLFKFIAEQPEGSLDISYNDDDVLLYETLG